jgi:phenylalanyl-tRNA synthetase alpha chain
MREELEEALKNALREIEGADGAEALEAVRIKYLGRKGLMRKLMKGLVSLSPQERPKVGKRANEVKVRIARGIDERIAQLKEREAKKVDFFDVTLPGERPVVGTRHPIIQTIEEICSIFAKLGFSVASGPEVELEFYNFDALNIPSTHPARDPQDNFYIRDDLLLRSQTSTVQIRVMTTRKPPFRIVVPGKVFRPDTVDASHFYQFLQVEGLMVDENVTFQDLKTVLVLFARNFLGGEIRLRFRPSYFPFTEPSAEVDCSCFFCQQKGCSVCRGKGWIELLGCGMVDPNVFEAVGYDPEKWTGFAFGMGIDRIAMLKHGISDIRLFTENDVRFLRQF